MTQKPLKIGLTGGAGTGKSTVCRKIIELMDVEIVDSDNYSRKVVEKGSEALSQIKKKFGETYILKDGNLNRKKMRDAIIKDSNIKKELEEIVHKQIINLIKKRLKNAEREKKNIIVEVPLLFELNLAYLFDFVVLIWATKAERINRLIKRDGITKEAAKALIKIQMPVEKKKKFADYIIQNSDNAEEVALTLKNIIIGRDVACNVSTDKNKNLY